MEQPSQSTTAAPTETASSGGRRGALIIRSWPKIILMLPTLLVSIICGFAMRFPEICFWMPTGWSIIFLIWGQASPTARAMYPPPLFPKKAVEKPVSRAQEDIEDIVWDLDQALTKAVDD